MSYNESSMAMNDTHPLVHRKHVELLREAGSRRRSALASSLTRQVISRARRGIALAHPEMTQIERDLLFVKVHYGRDLADRLRCYLDSRSGQA